MAELVVLVLDDPDRMYDVVNAWVAAGVSGVTILDSAGLGHLMAGQGAHDDLPLFPSLASLLRLREEPHRTLFAVVPDGFDVGKLAADTEKITGALDEADTGILFTVPVTRAWGLHRRRR